MISGIFYDKWYLLWCVVYVMISVIYYDEWYMLLSVYAQWFQVVVSLFQISYGIPHFYNRGLIYSANVKV